jgi:hypothetical protein
MARNPSPAHLVNIGLVTDFVTEPPPERAGLTGADQRVIANDGASAIYGLDLLCEQSTDERCKRPNVGGSALGLRAICHL